MPAVLWGTVLLKIFFHWRLCEAHTQVSLLHLVAWLIGIVGRPKQFIFTFIYISILVIKKVIKIHNNKKWELLNFFLLFPSRWVVIRYYSDPMRSVLPLCDRRGYWALEISGVFRIQVRSDAVAHVLWSSFNITQLCCLSSSWIFFCKSREWELGCSRIS